MKDQSKETDYEDIIHLPHHVSAVHPHMPVSDRAAQFAPFAALTGYGGVIKETARHTDTRPELSEDEKEILDHKIRIACGFPGERPEVMVTYFVPDEKKSGGAYHTAGGRIRRVDPDAGQLIMENGTQIDPDCVVDICFIDNI